jgi:hypothetical protein
MNPVTRWKIYLLTLLDVALFVALGYVLYNLLEWLA